MEQAKTLFAENKGTVVKVGAAVAGAFLGVLIVTALTTSPEDFLEVDLDDLDTPAEEA